MTPAKRIKQLDANLKVQDVADAVGVHKNNIIRWFETKPKLFEACLAAALMEKLNK